MALHPDTRLPPAIEAELRRAIDAAPDDELAALARNDPAFQAGGFRPGHTAPLRARALQLAVGAQAVSDALRRLIMAHSLNRPLVGLLSAGALADLRHELAALFGGPRLLLAMLADERADVRDLAARWLRQEPMFVAIEPAAAAVRVQELFGRLLQTGGGSAGAAVAVPASREAWHEAREHLEQQLRDSRAEARRLKGVDDRFARNREQLAAREHELADAQARLAAAETQARTAARECAEARTELARELRHREERLLAAVETRLASEAASWLAPVRAAAAEAVRPAAETDALLDRAGHALARQAEADRHSGDRRTLVVRRDALAQRLAEVRDALAHALQPLPELGAVERELSAEIDRLDGLLGRSGRLPLEELLAARLVVAGPAELAAARGAVQPLAALGVLPAEAVARLGVLLEQRERVARAGSVPAGTAGEDDSPAGILRLALAGRGTAVLLVDGHNVLFGLQGRYLPPQGAATPNGSTRARLVEDVVRLVADRPTCRAWIVFDGPTRSDQAASANVRVSYSGGEGEHRADATLLDNIRFFRAGGEIPIVLVTNDNALGSEARRLGARTLAALEFAALL